MGSKHPAKSAGNNNKQETINNTPDPALLPSAGQGGVVRQPDKQNPDPLWVVRPDDPGRAPAGAGRGRPAAALPSWADLTGRREARQAEGDIPTRAEWERVARLLETEGLDALTSEDRATYHAGHKAYASRGVVPE